jgi:dipeptide transport system permease protein
MLRFILNRLVLVIPTFIGISILSFGFIRLLPGDPVDVLSGQHTMSAQRHDELLHQFGLDRPIWQQYFDYVWHALNGDLGVSLSNHHSVMQQFLQLFPATVELSICALLIAIVLGVTFGMLAASRRDTWVDQLTMGGALVGYSMPIFWWGLLLIIVFSAGLHWFPVQGRMDLAIFFKPVTGFMLIDSLLSGQKGAFQSAIQHLVLPSIVLATIPLAVIARQTRSAMLEVLNEDYVRTARAKGLRESRVTAIHAFRNALIPVVTTIGLQVGTLLAGAVLTETIFSWPGIGKWMIEAIGHRDYTIVQGGLLMIAIVVMVVNLLVDVLYALINPRIRVQ